MIGGVFVRMLTDGPMWKKWAGMDHEVVGTYAPLPRPPELKPVMPILGQWKYTTENPGDGWTAADFNDGRWKTGGGGFGQGDTGAHPKTGWGTDDIWLRKTVSLPAGNFADLEFDTWHDEDVEIYVNGVLAGSASGYSQKYILVPMTPEGRAALKLGGKNDLAVHCHQTTGGQYIDVGIVNVTER